MADEDIIKEVRKDEYKEAILTWRHLQNVRYAIIGASITGFVGLIGAFQLAFPREAPAIEMGTAATQNPRLYVIGIIPIAGIVLGVAGLMSLFEWLRERLKLLTFGKGLENELGIVTKLQKKSKGFFSLATLGNSPTFMASFGAVCIMLIASIWAWYGVLQEVDAYKSRLPQSRPVILEPQRQMGPVPETPSTPSLKEEKPK